MAFRIYFLFLIFLLLTACSVNPDKPYQVELMPSPGVYEYELFEPFTTEENPLERLPYKGMLYATDRDPLDKQAQSRHDYLNQRGHLVRLGLANIDFGVGTIDWEEARRISLLKNRTDKYPIQIKAVEEYGILDRSIHQFADPELIDSEDVNSATKRYADTINQKLKASTHKDIYIYVHGYKVVFDNPILVATELWHFLGYEGVFIAYAWPSTPKRSAYFADIETASYSALYFRLLLDFLAEETNVERIHIIGYSAGTRMVTDALNQLALIHYEKTPEQINKQAKIGNVMLIGSDVDRQLFGSYLMNGLLNIPEQLSVYISSADKALGLSKWFFKQKRLGQDFDSEKMTPAVINYLQEQERISFINVTHAENSKAGNGHAYFRKSPWASSDILMTLMYDLKPSQRGLKRADDSPVWEFPPDYIDKLRLSIANHNPKLKSNETIK